MVSYLQSNHAQLIVNAATEINEHYKTKKVYDK